MSENVGLNSIDEVVALIERECPDMEWNLNRTPKRYVAICYTETHFFKRAEDTRPALALWRAFNAAKVRT